MPIGSQDKGVRDEMSFFKLSGHDELNIARIIVQQARISTACL